MKTVSQLDRHSETYQKHREVVKLCKKQKYIQDLHITLRDLQCSKEVCGMTKMVRHVKDCMGDMVKGMCVSVESNMEWWNE